MYVYVGVHVCVGMLRCVSSMHLYLFTCSIACYSISDLFGEIRTQLQETWTRSGFVLVMDPIDWRFGNRSMGWSSDSYQFVRWRPDGDLVPKLRHFMWVFALVLFFLFIVVSVIYMFLVSFHVTTWYIWLVWLLVPFHMISVSVHFYYAVYVNAYQRHFMW